MTTESTTPEEANRWTNGDLSALCQRIDSYVAAQPSKKPWYRDFSIIISALAFFVSICTTLISAYKAHVQDINTRKDALYSTVRQFYGEKESLIMALGAVVKEIRLDPVTNMPINDQKNNYANGIFAALNSDLRAIQQLASKQSVSIENSLGRNASATDLLYVGLLLEESNQFAEAGEVYQEALNRADNVYERVALIQLIGRQAFVFRNKDGNNYDREKAERYMKQSISTVVDNFKEDHKYGPEYIDNVLFGVYSYWISSTVSFHKCDFLEVIGANMNDNKAFLLPNTSEALQHLLQQSITDVNNGCFHDLIALPPRK